MKNLPSLRISKAHYPLTKLIKELFFDDWSLIIRDYLFLIFRENLELINPQFYFWFSLNSLLINQSIFKEKPKSNKKDLSFKPRFLFQLSTLSNSDHFMLFPLISVNKLSATFVLKKNKFHIFPIVNCLWILKKLQRKDRKIISDVQKNVDQNARCPE